MSLDYDRMPDEELAERAQAGDSSAESNLLMRYRPLVRIRTKDKFLVGAEKEDLVQEGLIGLYKAIQSYQKERDASFKTFADLCITRMIASSIRASTRMKQTPLNSYDSLDQVGNERKQGRISKIAGDRKNNPEQILIDKEDKAILEKVLDFELTELERKSLFMFIEGRTYEQIARYMHCSAKAVDNAIQRAKRKAQKRLTQND